MGGVDGLTNANLSAHEMSDVFEFRTLLEMESCALAAERATDEEIRTLKLLLDKMEKTQDDIVAFSQYDVMFHMHIAEMTKNSLLIKSVDGLLQVWLHFIYQIFAMEPDVKADAFHYHQIICDAIANHSPGLAREGMRLHMVSHDSRLWYKNLPEDLTSQNK